MNLSQIHLKPFKSKIQRYTLIYDVWILFEKLFKKLFHYVVNFIVTCEQFFFINRLFSSSEFFSHCAHCRYFCKGIFSWIILIGENICEKMNVKKREIFLHIRKGFLFFHIMGMNFNDAQIFDEKIDLTFFGCSW